MAGKKGKKGGGGTQQPQDQTSSNPQPATSAPQPQQPLAPPQQAPQASSSQVPPPSKQQPKQPKKGGEKSVEEQQPPAPAPAEPEGASEPAESGGGAKKKKKRRKKSAQGEDKDENAEPSTATPSPASAPAQGGPSTSGQSAKKAPYKKDAAKGAGEPPIGELQKMSVSVRCKYKIPPRIMKKQHDQTTCMKSVKIEVNYLPITFQKMDMDIFHYDVTFQPEKPKSLYRQAVHMIIRNNCPGRYPAFDGKKNLYAAKTHLFSGELIRDSVEIPDPEDNNRLKTFDIIIKKTPQKISMKQLKAYMEMGRSQEVPQDVVQATDIALRSGLYSMFIPCARSFFSGPMKPKAVDLGGGMELYDGFFQSAIMGQKKAFLNVDVSNKAFPFNQRVLDYLEKDLQVRNFNQDLDTRISKQLLEFIRGLKVIYVAQGERRSYRVNGLGLSATRYTFTPEGKGEMSVAEYFSKIKRINLKYPKLPLLHVGPPAKNTMVPMEMCEIVGRQVLMRKMDERQTAAMVRAAARPTDERKARIMNSIQSARYHENEVLTREFGITVNTRFHQVTSHVFIPPKIRYRNNQLVTPSNGEWKMEREQFLNPTTISINKWAVLIKDGRVNQHILKDPKSGLITLLTQCGSKLGIDIAPVCPIYESSLSKDQTESSIEDELKKFDKDHGGLQIVVVILPGNRKDAYGNVKRASEFRCGVLTQCLKADTVLRKMNSMTAINILLKMNAKVNGVNHTIDGTLKPAVFTAPVMFVGADVTHPAPGTEGNPSIAAVAASFDRNGFKYKMLYSLQGSRQEMIEDLREMMVKQLEHFMNSNKQKLLPVRILYYRDGVSEGQFSEVLTVELDALKQACSKFPNYQPKITFLVVQKRHHTRFFPEKRDGDGPKNNNVLAGTVVDTDITHPTETDFYLVSHKSIQGTARPTKYHVLFDENQFDCEELEILTYYLCYMFARCNRSVSYPAPTYYAHLAAFRARAWWDGQTIDLINLKREQDTRGTIHEAIRNGNPMFFV